MGNVILTNSIKKVVDEGYCIGCGACAIMDSRLKISLTEYGTYQADLNSASPDSLELASSVCPFSDTAQDEDAISSRLFGAEATKHNGIGYAIGCYAGYVREGRYRDNGTSGGLGSWIVAELLRRGYVDAVIHVKPSTTKCEGTAVLYNYAVSRTVEDVAEGAKSRYYPVEFSRCIQEVRTTGMRYAIVGLPCFIKAVRLLQEKDPIIKDKVRFAVGLVCGHLKSTAYAEMLAWQGGVEPNTLESVDFREKLPGKRAFEYGFAAYGKRNSREVGFHAPMASLFGGDWGVGVFKYKACDYCDDVLAETSDVVVGDAWLPEYHTDGRGTNVVVVRNKQIQQLLEVARDEGRLSLDNIAEERVVFSQRAGLAHRREGVSWRLARAQELGRWTPTKRVRPGEFKISKDRAEIYNLREEIAALSHIAFLEAKRRKSLRVFYVRMRRLIWRYERQYVKSRWGWLRQWMRRLIIAPFRGM